MTIQFTGLGSGMDYSSWIDALVEVKQAALTNIQTKIEKNEVAKTAVTNLRTEFSGLNSCVTKFTDSNIISAFDIFGRRKVSSSDEGKTASATVSNDANIQSFSLEVLQLATATVATGTKGLGKLADLSTEASTKLKNLNNGVISEGEISIYINNEKKVFEVDENTTLKDFKDFLLSEGEYASSGAGLANVELSAEGSLSFTANPGQTVQIGSTADTSNLLDFFGFKNSTDNPDTYSSEKILTEINTTGKIMSDGNLAEAVTESKFKIGTEEFTVDANTSISGLIYQINSNTASGVTASYDAVANKLVLTAKDPGATTINVEAIEGNFTDVVGWTDGGSLAAGSQVLGQNSKFKINDKEFIAASNTISEDVTGISGLTLSLNKVSNGDSAQISISSDYTEVESAITSFIEKFNTLIKDVKSASSKDGDLAYDSSLRRMSSELSNTIMNVVPGLSTYSTFSSIGISTGSSKTDVSDVSQELVFDKSKFEEAMAKNPNEVKKLFINLDEDDRSNNGVMTKLKDLIEGYTPKDGGDRVPGYLDVEKGYFAIKTESYTKQTATLNESLQRKQLLIEQYRARLEKQFQNMDNYVSQMSSYSNYLSSIGK